VENCLRDHVEQDLLELVRHKSLPDFSVTIECVNGRWRVELIDRESASAISTGVGASFTSAWLVCMAAVESKCSMPTRGDYRQ
jgi:hypothetical protein